MHNAIVSNDALFVKFSTGVQIAATVAIDELKLAINNQIKVPTKWYPDPIVKEAKYPSPPYPISAQAAAVENVQMFPK